MAINFDANWIDACSVATAIVYGYFKAKKQGLNNYVSFEFGTIVINGVAIFPIVVLMFSTFFSGLLNELANASRTTLFISSIFSLLAILEDKGQKVPLTKTP